MRILTIVSGKRMKSLFVQAKSTRSLCIRTKHVPSEINSAIVIPTIRDECATYRNFSELFHSCLQRNISSCKDGNFRDG